jgi:hypothetical protein
MALEQPRFSIPKQELPSFKLLARTSPETLQQLAESLAEQPPVLNVDKLSAPVAEASGVDQSDVEELLPLVWRWTMVQRRLDLSTEDFVTSLSAGLEALPNKEWSAEDRSGWANVRHQLQKLLSTDTAIASSAKAGELLLDQRLILCSSRVITDMRTVFDDSAESIRGILPYHTLVLRCREGADNHDVYVALDLDDLVFLREQLDRAEQKEKLLRTTLEDAGLTVIDTSTKAVA